MNTRIQTKLTLFALTFLAVPFAFAGEVSDADKGQTIDALFASMRRAYVFPDKATEAERAIRARLAAGDYANVKDGKAFAILLTEHLRAVCQDAHLHVSYSEPVLPVRKQNDQPSPAEIEQAKQSTRFSNAGFERVERLPGNVGYIKFNGFAPAEAAAAPVRAAMDFVANTDALIFDLRQNGGGSPETVRLICSYLFGETPVHLNDIYHRPTNKTTEFWTLRKVDGKRYLDREVYILTSKSTGSAAEEFSYNLKNLKRATLVGTSTWGGANPGDVIRLNDHFAAFVPDGRAINPITKTNWEGTGVEPDVKVAPEEALRTAHVLALKKLLAKATTDLDKQRLQRALAAVEAPRPR